MTADLTVPPQGQTAAPLTPRQRSLYRFVRNPAAVAGAVIVALVFLCAVFAPLIAPYPEHVGSFVDFRGRHEPPSLDHLFGTDNVGRDVFSRVVYGYRISLMLVVVVLGVSVPFGVMLGLVAGYFGGWIELVLMRVTDVALAIPPLVMALAITAVLSPNLVNAMIAISALWWTWHARLIYNITRTLRTQEYIEAAEIAGASKAHILFRELLPNCVSAITVKVTLDAGFVILIGAALSFLGLGAQPPIPDLGTMVSVGADYLPDRWWQSVLPGTAILFAILGFNLLGDGLRDLFDVEEVV